MEDAVEKLIREAEDIKNLSELPLALGDKWYLIDSKWFQQWKTYVGYDKADKSLVGDAGCNPGPIDNKSLLEDNGKLKKQLIEETNFVLVPEAAWNKLYDHYHLADNQDPIVRYVIDVGGTFNKSFKIEIYLAELNLCHSASLESVVMKEFSHVDSLEDVVDEMRKLFSISEDADVRLWCKHAEKNYEQLSKYEMSIHESGLASGQVLVIDNQDDEGTWIIQPKQLSAVNSSTSITNNINAKWSSGNDSGYDTYPNKNKVTPGLCGLSNLGNTCFMNSAIQCMSNVPALTEYMLSGMWKQELNKSNPLGMRGEVVTTYAELIRTMWSGKCSSTVPRQFKIAVGHFKPEFSGYQQQDSQELMAFLLDGLHEDLNRIRQKPYIEVKECDNRSDEEVAMETWRDYTKRNNSVIVDIFHGLLKSTLVCPECEKVSIKFDPFCYLSVPLPVKKERQMEVVFVPLNASLRPSHCKVIVPKMGCVADLCTAVSGLLNVPADRLVVTDVYNNRFHKVYPNHGSLTHISDRDDIFVYEVPVSSPEDPNTFIVSVYMREIRKEISSNYSSANLFGQPLLVSVPRKNCTYDDIYNGILKQSQRYVRMPTEEEWQLFTPQPASKLDSSVDGDEREDDDERNSEGEENEGGGASGGSASGGAVANGSSKRRLFSLCLVNACGTSDIRHLTDDDKAINVGNHPYIAADWSAKARELFYDENECRASVTDESMEQRMAPKKVIHLMDCLDLFATMEKLGEHDPWYCPTCKKHQQATKKFDIWQLPPVLVVHLKRFSYNRFWRDKLDTFVEYPTSGLDMSPFVINPNSQGSLIYDLIAVSNHYGGMGGGHYTAYAKNKETDKWFGFDDSCVSMTSEDSVVTKAGYVLVYQRRDVSDAKQTSSVTHDEKMETE